MDKDLENLLMEMAEGNPGAIRVMMELMWYTKWKDMLLWMKKKGYTGHKIWELYKDRFHQSWSDMGDWIAEEMYKESSKAEGLASFKGLKQRF